MYLIRLDDACPYMNIEKWSRIEKLLDDYGIKPIVAIIPNCLDTDFTLSYREDRSFWDKARKWAENGWAIGLHGFCHVFETNAGGLNPVNDYSEFAGVDIETQRQKIREGVEIFRFHGIEPDVFVAPAHTFDKGTLDALSSDSNIRVISDTIASDVYYEDGFYYIPQQAGSVRWMPLRTVTFCYHPNKMSDKAFEQLDHFIIKHRRSFANFHDISLKKRNLSQSDIFLRWLYFVRRE